MYCLVGKCPMDNKKPICCIYCSKNKDCPNACKRRNASCNLGYVIKDKKKMAKPSKIIN